MVRKKYLQFTSTMLVLLADQASCEAETTPGSFIVAFETLLAIGIFVSWVPQVGPLPPREVTEGSPRARTASGVHSHQKNIRGVWIIHRAHSDRQLDAIHQCHVPRLRRFCMLPVLGECTLPCTEGDG